MVRFTDKAREFWLQQALDHGEMNFRSISPEEWSGALVSADCHWVTEYSRNRWYMWDFAKECWTEIK